jgi:hypothetical protein
MELPVASLWVPFLSRPRCILSNVDLRGGDGFNSAGRHILFDALRVPSDPDKRGNRPYTGPVLQVSDLPGGLNGSMQHLLEVCLHESQGAKIIRGR